MSLQSETPPADGITAFFSRFCGSRPRPEPAPPAPDAPAPIAPIAGSVRRGSAKPARPARAIANFDAREAQDRRRNVIEVEKLARIFIGQLRASHYAYRALKDEFDRLCDDSALHPVTDRRFAAWLQEAGGLRYRADYPKVTMYRFGRRCDAARSAEDERHGDQGHRRGGEPEEQTQRAA